MAQEKNRVLSYLRKIFARDNFKGEDGPRDRFQGNDYATSSFSGLGAQHSYGAFNSGTDQSTSLDEDLLTRYADYEDMDDYPELSTAIDIFADDATQTDSHTGQIVHVESEDENIKEILETCFHTNLRIDEEIWSMARTLCKYGNNFEEHIVTENDGLINLNFVPPPQIRRIDGEDDQLLGFVYDKVGQFSVSTDDFIKRLEDRNHNDAEAAKEYGQVNVFEDWEVTHFRLRSKHRKSPYGYSIMESARWVMKRLIMLEDAAMIYKLSRAPQRFAFNVDVGDLPPNEALAYVNQVKNHLKKEKFVNQSTGKLDLAFNPMASDEDFFIPVRKDKPSMAIESVGGFDSSFYMDDMEYFKDKLYAAIKVPKDYLNFSEDSVSKANLSTEDIRFARTILRVQRELRTGLINIGRVHLAALGRDPDLLDFDIYLTSPSAIFEQAVLEVKQTQLDIAENYRAFVDDYWIMTNILKFSDQEVEEIGARLKKQKMEDDPFGENRFPNIENRQRLKMNKEVKAMMEDFGVEALKRDKVMGKRIIELQGLSKDIKSLLAKK